MSDSMIIPRIWTLEELERTTFSDRAPVASEYNAENASILITHVFPFLRFPEEFLCWVGISRNYLLNKDTYPRFEYESGEGGNGIECFHPTADPRKVRIVELVRPSGELSARIEREFVGDAGGSGGGDQEIASVGGHGNVEPIVPTTDNVVAEIEAPGPRRSKKKRVPRGSEGIPASSHPPKRLRADYGTTGGSAVGGKSPSVLNRLLQDSLLTVEQGAKSADLEADSFVRSAAPVMTTATTVTTFVSSVAATATTSVDVGKDKDVPAPSVFACSSSSDKTDRTLSLFTRKSECPVTKGFELNDGRSCANMIDHFTPPAFFKTVRRMEHEQLFAEFDVSAARNLSLSSKVRMCAEYNILEKKKWKSLAEEKDNLLQVKDKEIEELRSQLLHAKDESIEVARLRTRVSSLEAIEGSLRGEVASAKEHNGLLEQEHSALKLKMTSLESIIAEKDRKLSDLRTSASSLRSQNQSLVTQVHELETSSTGLREKLEMYEGSMRQLEEFQDSLMKPLEARLAEIDADFTRCCMHFQENFHPHLLNAIAGRRWLLTHGMKLLMAKCLNSTEYMEAIGNAFGRAFEKGITLDVMDLLRLDDVVAEVLGMTGLQPDVGQLMVPVHHKQDKVVIGSQAFFVALETCHRRVRKMERNLAEHLSFLKYVFVSIDHPVSAEALDILSETSTEPPVTALITTALSTVVIRPNSDPFLLVKDYENPDLAGVVPEDVILGPEGEGKVEGSTKGDVDDVFSQFENEARDAVL
ncbi:hypothetical protein Tco_0598616 [Tanacetum coccineum]